MLSALINLNLEKTGDALPGLYILIGVGLITVIPIGIYLYKKYLSVWLIERKEG
jgi:hypothetical protein